MIRYRYVPLFILSCLLLPHNAGAVSYTYDLVGNRLSMTDPSGTTIYAYDALNRVTSITNPSGQTTIYEYDAIGRRIKTILPNGIITSYAYDATSRLTSLTHTLSGATLASFTYTYDKVGNRISMTDEYGTHTYTYDPKYQLIQATHPNQSTETYSYDGVGNRLGGTYDAANRLLGDDNYLYSYDKNGNTTQKMDRTTGEVIRFYWSAENQLTKLENYHALTDPTPYSTARYIYDGIGRRVAKNVDGNVIKYVYDQEDILLETDVSDQIIARYTHGPGVDEPISVERNGQSYYYLADGLGSIVKVVDSAGNVVNSYVYDSFGNITSQNGSLVNPYTYTAREYDTESGLYYYRFRYYDPKPGRFISLDPILKLAIQDSPELLLDLLLTFQVINQYVYVDNNPINRIDPYGLWYKDCSYYVKKCNETGHWYYCYVARLGCSLIHVPKTDVDDCVRQCLQDHDRIHCKQSNTNGSNECNGDGEIIGCAYKAHLYCFRACISPSYPRPPFPPIAVPSL